jgi:hypothetical protein
MSPPSKFCSVKYNNAINYHKFGRVLFEARRIHLKDIGFILAGSSPLQMDDIVILTMLEVINIGG